MIQAGNVAGRADRSLAIVATICGVMSILLLAALSHLLGVSPVPLLLGLGAAFLLWLAYAHTVGCVGAFLAFMPFFPLAFLLARFFGPSYIGKIEGIDRVVLLLLTLFLLIRNRIRLILPDFLLMAAFGLAVVRLPFDGSLLALASDFGLVIPYAAGRLIRLSAGQEAIWAKRAVWIVTVVSLLGFMEVFVLGESPRTLLYFKVAQDQTEGGDALIGTFHAAGFAGLRVSGTEFGPLPFGVLCMLALVIWWVYSRKPIPGAIIGIGLIGSLTRAAWVGTALAIPAAAATIGQARRFLKYGVLALVLFVASVPILGLGDYLSATRSGEDPSAKGHQNAMLDGAQFALEHPLGIGSRNYGRQAEKSNQNAFYFEGGYFTFLGGYGIPITLTLLAFMFTAARRSWQQRTPMSSAACGILAGFSTVMLFLATHDIFPLACWIWFPLGLSVRASISDPGTRSFRIVPG